MHLKRNSKVWGWYGDVGMGTDRVLDLAITKSMTCDVWCVMVICCVVSNRMGSNGIESVEVPKEILSCRAVTREMDFSSVERIRHFRLVQEVFLRGIRLEEWSFDFGKVIPESRNTWSCTIEAAPPDQMLPASLLSGNVTIETSFYDGEQLVSKSTLRVYYI